MAALGNTFLRCLAPDADKKQLIATQVYVFTFCAYFSRAIWEGSIISSFVYLITNASSLSIGSLTGTLGFTQLFVAPCMGYLSDKLPRTWILMLASFVGLFATFLSFYAVNTGNYYFLLHCMIAWGVFWGTTTPTIDAVLADSIDAGKRSEAYTFRSSLMNVATSFGPLISSFLFYFIGDHWKLNELKLVMSIGLSLFFIPCVILFSFYFIHDDESSSTEIVTNLKQKLGNIDSLICNKIRSYVDNSNTVTLLSRFKNFSAFKRGTRSESQGADIESDQGLHMKNIKVHSGAKYVAGDNSKDILNYSRLSTHEENEADHDSIQVLDETDGKEGIYGGIETKLESSARKEGSDLNSNSNISDEKANSDVTNNTINVSETTGTSTYLLIASMIAGGDVLTGLASGMTIKFFPIFFMTKLGLSPLKISLIYFITPLFTTLFAQFTQKLGLRWGRIFATLFMKSFGISLMLLLASFAVHRDSIIAASNNNTDSSKVSYKYLPSNVNILDNCILLIFVIRTASMNCSKGLTKSIIMDVVPKDQRGQWNALESINNATFSGSAILGGYLVDKYGFVHNFLCTALLQAIALIPLIVIRNDVKNEAA